METRLEERTVLRQLCDIAAPITIQFLVMAAVGIGDTAMLGFVSQDALAAVSLANQVIFVLNLFFGAVASGLAVLAAQYWGNGDKASLYWTFCLSVRNALIISGIFLLCSEMIPELLVGIFTDEPALIRIGGEYLRIAGMSCLFTGISQCCHSVLKSTGRTKQSAVIGVFSLVLDLVLNAVFIFGLLGFPAMGVRGAAWTTVISRLVEMVLIAWKLPFLPQWEDILYSSARISRTFWRYTAPILINCLVWGLGTASYAGIIGHLGGDAAAANAITAVVRELAECVCRGLSLGGGILLGNLLGAGELEQAKQYGGKLCKYSIICGFVCMGIVLVAVPLLSGFLRLTDTAQMYLVGMLTISALYMLGRSVNTVVVTGIFHAGGDTVFDAVSVALSMWLFVIPFAAVTAFWLNWPVLAVYLVLCLDEVVKLPWVYRHYKKYKWIHNITRRNAQ